jgi:hypothetical protein
MKLLDRISKLFPASYREAGGVVPEADRAARLRQKSARAQDPDVAPVSSRSVTQASGLHDRGRPTERTIRKHNVSLFGKLVHMRADATARAIVGEQGEGGFSVQREAQGGAEEVEPGHPWKRLLRRPNGAMPAYVFWHWASRVVDLWGACDLYVEHDRTGTPSALWPIFPEWGEVRPVLGRKGAVQGWVYYRGGERDELEARDIVRLSLPDVTNLQETESLLERGIYELNRELHHANYESDFLEEGRPPNVYMTFDGSVDVRDNQEAADRMQNRYMGKRANRVPAFGNGGELKSVALSPDDLQMLESREMTERRLHTITGVPEALFKTESSNRSTGEAAHWTLAQYTIQPRAVSLASQMRHGFERAFGADEGALMVVAPDVTPTDATEQEEINERRLRRGVPAADIMREQGEEVPDEHEEDLETPRLPSTLTPIGSGGEGAPDFL